MKLSWANRITIFRILFIVPFVIFMLKINQPEISGLMRHLAMIVFVFMAFSDVVDGYLARSRNQVTKLGSFLDPLADKLLMVSACLLLASERSSIEGFKLPPTVVVLIVGKDILVTLGFLVLYLVTFQVRVVPVTMGKFSTFVQNSMVTAVLIAPDISKVLPGWIWFVRVLWWSAAAIAVCATLIYIRNGSRYIEQFEQQSKS